MFCRLSELGLWGSASRCHRYGKMLEREVSAEVWLYQDATISYPKCRWSGEPLPWTYLVLVVLNELESNCLETRDILSWWISAHLYNSKLHFTGGEDRHGGCHMKFAAPAEILIIPFPADTRMFILGLLSLVFTKCYWTLRPSCAYRWSIFDLLLLVKMIALEKYCS